jgi:hypothetical protein
MAILFNDTLLEIFFYFDIIWSNPEVPADCPNSDTALYLAEIVRTALGAEDSQYHYSIAPDYNNSLGKGIRTVYVLISQLSAQSMNLR